MPIFISRERLYLEKVNGTVAEIRKLSILATEEFRQTLNEINDEVNKEEYKEVTITEAYINNKLFAHLLDRLFSLLSLKVEEFDGELLMRLLFPHYLPDGSYQRQGMLPRFILGEVKGGATVEAEAVNHYAKLLGELWSSVRTFTEVSEAVDQLDYDTLIEALKYKAAALKPAVEKEKEASIAKAKEEFAKYKAQKSKKNTLAEIDLEDLI